jgi:hypothetical protein
MAEQQSSTSQPIDYRRTFINSCPIKHTMWVPDDIDLNPFTGTDFEPLPEVKKPWRVS